MSSANSSTSFKLKGRELLIFIKYSTTEKQCRFLALALKLHIRWYTATKNGIIPSGPNYGIYTYYDVDWTSILVALKAFKDTKGLLLKLYGLKHPLVSKTSHLSDITNDTSTVIPIRCWAWYSGRQGNFYTNSILTLPWTSALWYDVPWEACWRGDQKAVDTDSTSPVSDWWPRRQGSSSFREISSHVHNQWLPMGKVEKDTGWYYALETKIPHSYCQELIRQYATTYTSVTATLHTSCITNMHNLSGCYW